MGESVKLLLTFEPKQLRLRNYLKIRLLQKS